MLCGLMVSVVLSSAPVSSFIYVFGDFWSDCAREPLPSLAEFAEVLCTRNGLICTVGTFCGVSSELPSRCVASAGAE